MNSRERICGWKAEPRAPPALSRATPRSILAAWPEIRQDPVTYPANPFGMINLEKTVPIAVSRIKTNEEGAPGGRLPWERPRWAGPGDRTPLSGFTSVQVRSYLFEVTEYGKAFLRLGMSAILTELLGE